MLEKPNPLTKRLHRSVFLAVQLKGQSQTPFWGTARLRRVQNRAVRRAIRFAARYVPYYRELLESHSFDPAKIRSVEDLSQLPVVTPLDVRRDPEKFQPEGKHLDTLRLVSSGTTGIPRWIYHDASALFQNAAHGRRSAFFYSNIPAKGRGLREALIVAPLQSAVQKVQEFNRSRAWLPSRLMPDRIYLSLLDDMAECVNSINEFRPHVIRSYGSGLNMLCEHLFRTRQEFHHPDLMLYSADGMSHVLKRKVMEEMGIPVYSYYSSVECPQLGYECEHHRGYHLNEDAYPVRVVDEHHKELPAGETGKIMVSNLVNRGTVLLNYELGDEGRIIPGPCSCGRTQRLLSLEIVKVGDIVDAGNGFRIHPLRFIKALTDGKDLWQHQIVEKEDGSFDILLVADPAADREAMARRLEEGFATWFQGRINYQIHFVERIALTRGGKQRSMVLRSHGQS